jgi:N-acetylglucosaminyldiphosphoundecaprenol N-acetyl-beta-D-mannosaminyltransferase
MIDLGKRNVLGILVDALDYEAAVKRIIEAACNTLPLAVSALAVHGVMTGVLDPVHKYRLNTFDLVLPDGQPVRWALNWLHDTNLADRVYGPDLTLGVCQEASRRGLPVYFYGSSPEVLNELQTNLRRRFPDLKICGSQPSKFRQITDSEKHSVISTIKKSGAAIVLVGLGCPRQEVWVYEYRQELSLPLLSVGAAFPFHAGAIAQAPEWMQRRGLEWLFRLAHEPRRLWRRYLLLNPLYLLLILAQAAGFGFSTAGDRPCKQLQYG